MVVCCRDCYDSEREHSALFYTKCAHGPRPDISPRGLFGHEKGYLLTQSRESRIVFLWCGKYMVLSGV